MNNYKSYTVIGIILIGIFLISFSTSIEAKGLDENIRDLVLETETESLDQIMHNITKLGNREMVPLVFLMPDNEFRKDTFKSLLFTTAVTQGLKIAIGEKRPRVDGTKDYKPFTQDTDYHAMPSGHATGSFTVATVLSKHYPKYKKYFYTVSTLIAASRMYEDAHWFSNIVAGAGVGYYGTKFVLKRW
ncbi:MAG: phosphatase PAP2 family protein [Candidatus Woesearchaeota archaeon]